MKRNIEVYEQVINGIPDIEDWLDENFIHENNLNN